MPKKTGRNTKGKIVSTAWKLFYEQGYDDTTVEDIILESGTSKGSFYHYFEGKDSLLGSLSILFDEKYEELQEQLPEDLPVMDALLLLNRELFSMIENSISLELLAQLLSSQLITKGERHLLNRNRTYFRLLHRLVKKGQERGELLPRLSANQIVSAYAMLERALLYEWCLNGGSYSLTQQASQILPVLLKGYILPPSAPSVP